eukprot:scaffold312063_cov15-Tisochrysis_lutea.AAC.1
MDGKLHHAGARMQVVAVTQILRLLCAELPPLSSNVKDCMFFKHVDGMPCSKHADRMLFFKHGDRMPFFKHVHLMPFFKHVDRMPFFKHVDGMQTAGCSS